jgi:hypothetical protein
MMKEPPDRYGDARAERWNEKLLIRGVSQVNSRNLPE